MSGSVPSSPRLSIVIASCVGPPFISRCLESIDRQRKAAEVEVIVVDRAGGEVAADIRRDYPWARLIGAPAGTPIPDLRRTGVQEASADFVAIIEEHCVARNDWIAAILRCTQSDAAAWGGPVCDADYDRRTDWAMYFTEYNAYMPPFERGPTRDICAVNCVFRRDALLRHLPPPGGGFWEAGLNRALAAAGERIVAEPDMVVYKTGPFPLEYYLRQRYLVSRAFAGDRRRTASPLFVIAYLMLAPLVPWVLLWRIGRRVRAKRARFDQFLRALPVLVPASIAYVWGEWVGLLLGPGESWKRIE